MTGPSERAVPYTPGDTVRYKRWTGVVREVQPDGRLLLDWTGPGYPFPFFHGPYRPDEVSR
jgi:hypothetical protein